jgi:mRNA-degrading endonuclease RelE of RelBE toxin-antitoxin system
MDKIQTALNKLSKKERGQIKIILIKLNSGSFKGLDVVKLKGRTDIFRMRSGKLRVIFRLRDKTISILAIERRSEKTYRDF